MTIDEAIKRAREQFIFIGRGKVGIVLKKLTYPQPHDPHRDYVVRPQGDCYEVLFEGKAHQVLDLLEYEVATIARDLLGKKSAFIPEKTALSMVKQP